MVLSIINSVSVAIVFPKHNRVQEPHTASAPTVAWRPAVAFLRGEGRSAGFSKTLNQYAYQNQHLVMPLASECLSPRAAATGDDDNCRHRKG